MYIYVSVSLCGAAQPYGAIELEHVLNASLIVSPGSRHIFVATDDEPWLHEALAEYSRRPNNLLHQHKLHLHAFTARHGHRNHQTTDVAAEFFATIEVGQQCRAFVGYSGCSAVAQLFFEAMCFKNQLGYLQCPDVYKLC
jgi:hypothetical protein